MRHKRLSSPEATALPDETPRIVPPVEHESCARKIAELSERVQNLELTSVERHLQVMELAEKVAERLQDRVRKRNVRAEPEMDELDRIIAIRRGKFRVHEG